MVSPSVFKIPVSGSQKRWWKRKQKLPEQIRAAASIVIELKPRLSLFSMDGLNPGSYYSEPIVALASTGARFSSRAQGARSNSRTAVTRYTSLYANNQACDFKVLVR
jgi:hypothetical protein